MLAVEELLRAAWENDTARARAVVPEHLTDQDLEENLGEIRAFIEESGGLDALTPVVDERIGLFFIDVLVADSSESVRFSVGAVDWMTARCEVIIGPEVSAPDDRPTTDPDDRPTNAD